MLSSMLTLAADHRSSRCGYGEKGNFHLPIWSSIPFLGMLHNNVKTGCLVETVPSPSGEPVLGPEVHSTQDA